MRRRGTWLVVAALAGIGLAATVDALRGEKEAPQPAARQAATGAEKNTAEETPAVHEVPASDGSPSPSSFVDSINKCERLLVTRQEVKSALGFRADDPAPTRSAGGVFSGCEYASLNKEQSVGQVVISAYTADAPPIPVGRSRPVRGIGDEAEFAQFGNGDVHVHHVDGPEGATSMLQVRSGDLILRFNGGVVELPSAMWFPYGLPRLRQLAEDALATLAEIQAFVDSVPKVDYVIDLNTSVMTPLPRAVIRSLGETDESGQYAASPDGSLLAYVGTGDEGSPQIFIAGIDGDGVRQMTHDPTGAAWPAWSPDGTRIAYVGYGSRDVPNLFVLDVATGESTQISDGTRVPPYDRPQFTPDGLALLYTGGSGSYPVLRTVPVAGGKSTLLIGPGEGLTDAGNGSLSPDGSLVTFLGGGWPRSGKPAHCGPCRWVANADGTERRVIPGWVSNPAGTWAPDGGRIVCSDYDGDGIIVVDIATGNALTVAEGSGAIWLDRHTLLVEV